MAMTKMKKALSLLITLAMVFTLVPGMTVTVRAEATEGATSLANNLNRFKGDGGAAVAEGVSVIIGSGCDINIDGSEIETIAIPGSVTLEINGGTLSITGKNFLTNTGKLKLINGTLNIQNNSSWAIANEGTIDLSGGTAAIENSGGFGIQNEGTINIVGSAVTISNSAEGSCGIENKNTLNVASGSLAINNTAGMGIRNHAQAHLNISGSATLSGNGIDNIGLDMESMVTAPSGTFTDGTTTVTNESKITVGLNVEPASATGLTAGVYVWDSTSTSFKKARTDDSGSDTPTPAPTTEILNLVTAGSGIYTGSGGGTATWDANGKILTLNNFVHTSSADFALAVPNNTVIMLAEGTTNRISVSGNTGDSGSGAIYLNDSGGPITITGKGSLETTGGAATYAESCGISVASLTISGGANVLSVGGAASGSNTKSVGVFCKNISLEGEGSELIAKGGTAEQPSKTPAILVDDSGEPTGLIVKGDYGTNTFGSTAYWNSFGTAYSYTITSTGGNCFQFLKITPAVPAISAPTDATLDFTSTGAHKTSATYNGSSSGTAEWNADTNTLTLTGFKHTTSATTAVKIPDGTKIILNNYSEISGGDAATDTIGLFIEAGTKGVEVSGTGTMLIKSGAVNGAELTSTGIKCESNSFTINSGTVNAEGKNGSGSNTASVGFSGKAVAVKGGNLTAIGRQAGGASYGVYYTDSLAVTGSAQVLATVNTAPAQKTIFAAESAQKPSASAKGYDTVSETYAVTAIWENGTYTDGINVITDINLTAVVPVTTNSPIYFGKGTGGTWNLWTNGEMTTAYTTGLGDTWKIEDGILKLDGFHLTNNNSSGMNNKALVVKTANAKIELTGVNSIKNTNNEGIGIHIDANNLTFSGTGSLTAEGKGANVSAIYSIQDSYVFTISGSATITAINTNTSGYGKAITVYGSTKLEEKATLIASSAGNAATFNKEPTGVGTAVGSITTTPGTTKATYNTTHKAYMIDSDFTKYLKLTTESRSEVTISATAATDLVYNGSEQTGYTGTVTSGAYTGELVYTYTGRNGTTYTASSTPPTNVGDYTLTISVPETDNDYMGTTSLNFSIAKAALIIGPKNASVIQGGAMPEFELEYSGIASGDTVTPSKAATFACTADDTNTLGTFDIIWMNADTTTFTGAGNYSITTSDKGTLTVSEKSTPPPIENNTNNNTDDSDTDDSDEDDNDNSTTTATTTIPVDTESKTTSVEINKSGNNVTLELTDKKVEDIIKNADENVTFDLSKVKNAETAIIPIKAVEAMSEESIGITVKLPEAEITVAAEDLKDLVHTAKGSETLRIEAGYIKPTNLTAEQKATVEGKRVIDINVFLGTRKIDVPVTVSIPYELADGEDPDGVCVWYMDDKGNLTKMKGSYDIKTGMFTFYTGHQSYYLIGYEQPKNPMGNAFTDIKGHWGYDAICYMVENGIMSGINSTTFQPNTNLSRAMMVQILWNLEGKPVATNAIFADVESGAWYAKAVAWASANGIVNGFGNGNFGPNESITREQMVTILRNYAEFKGADVSAMNDLNSFADVDAVSDWALKSIQWAVEEEIIGGKPNGLIDPKGTATRAEIAQTMMNFITKIK